MVVMRLHERFWQVVVDGDVVGYVDTVGPEGAERYRVRRLRWPSGRWVAVGEWWEFDAAIEACADAPPERLRGRDGSAARTASAEERRRARGFPPPQTRWFGS